MSNFILQSTNIYENGYLMKTVYGETEDVPYYDLYEYDENWVLQRISNYAGGKLRWIAYYIDGKFDHDEHV